MKIKHIMKIKHNIIFAMRDKIYVNSRYLRNWIGSMYSILQGLDPSYSILKNLLGT